MRAFTNFVSGAVAEGLCEMTILPQSYSIDIVVQTGKNTITLPDGNCECRLSTAWLKLEGTSLPNAAPSLASLNNDADTDMLSFQTEQERGNQARLVHSSNSKKEVSACLLSFPLTSPIFLTLAIHLLFCSSTILFYS